MHIAIIGGGAAGLMAAAAAQETNPEADVSLIERNTVLGKKIMLSGGGRCNVTTGLQDIRHVLERYPRGKKFLSSVMHQFPPSVVMEWFEAHGVPLKTEDDFRVFPKSNSGRDVVAVFEKLFRAPNSRVRVRFGQSATTIAKNERGFTITFTSGQPMEADRLILTTGGQAYRHTGSRGDGYAFAESLGHTITPLAPSLSSLTTREMWPKELTGLSIPYARISVAGDTKRSYDGPFLFTHHGLSGPAVFALSSLVAFERIDPAHLLAITINLFPDERTEDLVRRIGNFCRANGKKNLQIVLGFLLPKTLAVTLCAETRLDGTMHAAQTTKRDIEVCANWMQAIPLHITGRGAGDEFVTAGGVNTDEVNPRTMESNICPGLFFAGEILNVDGFTGGFNLQASWATGYAAGIHAAA